MDFTDFLGKDKIEDVDENLFVKCDKIFQQLIINYMRNKAIINL